MQQQNFIVKSANNNEAIVSGYASVFNSPDQDNDIITKGTFTSGLDRQVKFLWQHDAKKPIGVIISLCEDEIGLKVEAQINSKIETGKEAIELIRQGAVNGLSIGFNILSSEYNELGQRIITEAELIEISIVTFPANKQAQIHYIDNDGELKKQEKSEYLKLKDVLKKLEFITTKNY